MSDLPLRITGDFAQKLLAFHARRAEAVQRASDIDTLIPTGDTTAMLAWVREMEEKEAKFNFAWAQAISARMELEVLRNRLDELKDEAVKAVDTDELNELMREGYEIQEKIAELQAVADNVNAEAGTPPSRTFPKPP
jgi:hypothetical protein